MDSDLKVIMHELTNLKRQAEAGKIDRERWLHLVAYLRKLDCPVLADSVELSLRIYERIANEWLLVMDIQSPAMAESEE